MSSTGPLAGYVLEGRFQLEALLGQGAMGTVYQALDTNSQRRVAVKLLQGDDPRRRERFRREGQATAALQHPGILRIHSIGEQQGRAYLVYELVEGCQELGDVLDSLPLRRRVELVRDAARALGYAHQQGVVHRDVKPANLLVDSQGRLFVADFGLALIADTERLTRSGALLGTPTHMAPEQVHGLAHKSKAQVDVWALGVVLYQALTGELPFEADDWITLAAKITSGDPDRPSSIKGDVPKALEAICFYCLQVDPSRRYVDGELLAQDLDAWLEGRAVLATQRRRVPALVGFAAGLLAVSLLVVAALWIAGEDAAPTSSESRPRVGRVSLPELKARNRAAEAGRELEHLRFVEPIKRIPALRTWMAANPTHPKLELARAAYKEAGYQIPLAEFKTGLAKGPSRRKVVATWIGDDRVLTCCYSQRIVELWDVSDLEAPRPMGRWEGPAPKRKFTYVAQSLLPLPDGQRFVWGGEYADRLWRGALDSPGTFDTWELPENVGTVRRMAPGGTPAEPLIFLLCGERLRVFDPSSWPPQERVVMRADGQGYLGALSVSPDGMTVAALMRRESGLSSEGDTLFVWKLADEGGQLVGEQVLRKPLQNTMASVAFAPDGKTLAVGLRRGLLTVLSLDSPGAEWIQLGREDALLGRAHASGVDSVGYSPDGRWLYSMAEFKSQESTGVEEDRTGELVVWETATGKAVRRLSLPAPTQSVEVDPAGRLLLGLNRGIVQIWVGQ